jgi:NAD(P)-dependent dehydrogenase (short-subunit alcohol dehydrogenase family)
MKLHGKVAVVTGGLRGIGHAIALALAGEGAEVLIAGQSMERAVQAEQEIQALGRRCAVLQVDVSDEEAVRCMVAATVQRFGGLDILVNNAGIALFKPIEEFTLAEFSRVMDVNVKGPWLCAKYAFPELKRRRGAIINITSASGHYGGASPGGSAYDASKAGLRQMTCSLAAEFGPYGIRVNAIAPGVIVTERLGGQGFVSSEVGRHEMGRTPLRRLGNPADVGRVAAFLASDDASYINGTTIILDGGSMAVW